MNRRDFFVRSIAGAAALGSLNPKSLRSAPTQSSAKTTVGGMAPSSPSHSD